MSAYQDLHLFEREHWWFVGRRRIIEWAFCDALGGRIMARALDVGCGTGWNSRLLKKFAREVVGTDVSSTAWNLATSRVPGVTMVIASFPEEVPEPGRHYGCILLADVLEHIRDDGAALRKVAELLEPGGVACFTVPAFPFLWSNHDRIAGHWRRYTKTSLIKVISTVPSLAIVRVQYCNSFLFPAVAAIRLIKKWFRLGAGESDLFNLPRSINTVLAWIFGAERYLLQHISFPFGVSLVCTVIKK
ncbi:MAG: class I SAM-dependent methyltransferase [bacterium]|nr:class I SAM-dependent methyltransferase [bacterium]